MRLTTLTRSTTALRYGHLIAQLEDNKLKLRDIKYLIDQQPILDSLWIDGIKQLLTLSIIVSYIALGECFRNDYSNSWVLS